MPYPPTDGGTIAMNSLTEGLFKAGCEVKVMAINTPKHFIKEETIDRDYRRKTKFVSVFVNTNVTVVGAFLNLFTNQSYNIKRFYNNQFETELVEILKQETFEVVQLEGIWLAPYLNAIRKNSQAAIMLRSHNVEYLIWEQLAATTINPIKKWYLTLLAKRLKNYEVTMLNKYDGIATITNEDAEAFRKHGCTIPIITIPFGVDVSKYKIDKQSIEFPSVFHLGAMDWMPNADGIKWFLENVWQQVTATHPNVKLYLAGRGMPDWLKQWKMKNVVIVGEVENSHQFINSKGVMVVPLNSGSGMRVKIIEGMAFGKTIVSTAIGAEGIECENGKDILIATTAEEFVTALNKCLNDKLFSETIAKNARIMIESKYDNLIICKKLTAFYNKLITHNS